MMNPIEIATRDLTALRTAVSAVADQAREAVHEAGGYPVRVYVVYRATDEETGEGGALATIQGENPIPDGWDLVTGESFPVHRPTRDWATWLGPMVRSLPILPTTPKVGR